MTIVVPTSITPITALAAASIASTLIGVDRAWALIGGRGRGRTTSLVDLVRGEQPDKES